MSLKYTLVNRMISLKERVSIMIHLLADKLGVDPDEIINKKMDQNEAKYPVEKAKGSSAKYNEL